MELAASAHVVTSWDRHIDSGTKLPEYFADRLLQKEVVEQLNSKHPDADCTLEGPILVYDPILFNVIDGDVVRRSAKLTRGSSGPPGMDSEAWERILVSKHFQSVGTNL